MSSRPGQTLSERTSRRMRRHSGRRSGSPGPRTGMFLPSKLPRSVAPNHAIASSASGSPLERLAQLLHRPDVEPALLALGVGVEGRVEAALGAAHLAQRPVEGLLADPPEEVVMRDQPAVQVDAGQQRVVVQHLLEVGHEPIGVHRVAREAAADLVVHPARRHRAQRAGASSRSRLGAAGTRAPTPAGTSARCRSRRWRRRTESAGSPPPGRAPPGSSARPRATAPPRRAAVRPRARRRRESRRVACPRPRPPPRAPAASSAFPGAAAAGSRSPRRRAPAPGVRKTLSGQPPEPGHGLAGLHVDRVEVRPFLAVELDRHEALIHQRRDLGILERLAFHHVTPVAGRVADREQQRPVLLARASQRLLAPGVPVHRVVLVLEQVGGGLVCQAIGHVVRLPGAASYTDTM